jgi:hypothetical protein
MHRNTKVFLGSSLFALVLFWGCKPNVAKAPIDVPQMKAILRDVHLAEAYSGLLAADTIYHQYGSKNIDSLAYFYKEILDKHQVSIGLFDSALKWYSLHPMQFDSAYTHLLPIYDSLKSIRKTPDSVAR